MSEKTPMTTPESIDSKLEYQQFDARDARDAAVDELGYFEKAWVRFGGGEIDRLEAQLAQAGDIRANHEAHLELAEALEEAKDAFYEQASAGMKNPGSREEVLKSFTDEYKRLTKNANEAHDKWAALGGEKVDTARAKLEALDMYTQPGEYADAILELEDAEAEVAQKVAETNTSPETNPPTDVEQPGDKDVPHKNLDNLNVTYGPSKEEWNDIKVAEQASKNILEAKAQAKAAAEQAAQDEYLAAQASRNVAGRPTEKVSEPTNEAVEEDEAATPKGRKKLSLWKKVKNIRRAWRIKKLQKGQKQTTRSQRREELIQASQEIAAETGSDKVLTKKHFGWGWFRDDTPALKRAAKKRLADKNKGTSEQKSADSNETEAAVADTPVRPTAGDVYKAARAQGKGEDLANNHPEEVESDADDDETTPVPVSSDPRTGEQAVSSPADTEPTTLVGETKPDAPREPNPLTDWGRWQSWYAQELFKLSDPDARAKHQEYRKQVEQQRADFYKDA